MKITEPKQLPSGSWHIRVMVDGVRKSITCPTRKQCLAEAAALKTGAKRMAMPTESKSLAEAYEDYISQGSGRWSPSTLAGYKRLSRNTFQPLMPCKVGRITQAMIQKEIDRMLADGKSRKYCTNALGLLHAVLSDVLPDSTFKIKLPQRAAPAVRDISDEDITAIMQVAKGTEMELPILLAAWMGMRMSEIRGLKRKDIQDGKVHVCRAVVDDADGHPCEKRTKSYAGDRWLPLPEYIAQLIPPREPDEYIVHLSGQAIYKRWCRLLEKAGVPHCRFHDLRRLNAAAMIRLGVDSKYAQARNGWASDYMYKQVYGYAMADRLADTNAAIDQYFGNKIANGDSK